MKFTKSVITRIVSFLTLLVESEYGVDMDSGKIGAVVPGMLKEDGTPNNKGNVVTTMYPWEAGGVIGELRTFREGGRDKTAQEAVRRSIMIEDGIVSFRTSEDSGTRTVKVAAEDFFDGEFVEIYALQLGKAINIYNETVDAQRAGEVPTE